MGMNGCCYCCWVESVEWHGSHMDGFKRGFE